MPVVDMNRQIILARRPRGEVTSDDFRLVIAPIPTPRQDEVLVRHHWLSIDPYMRVSMNDAKSYAAPQRIDAVMLGGTAGEVIASRHRDFAVGDRVIGMGGWQLYAVADGRALVKVDTSEMPLSAYLGSVGMPGITAWFGVRHVIKPAAGETIVVSAASGAVGGVAGQLAKLANCRVVGIAGGPQKCRYVVEELGFDACLDHKLGNLDQQLEAAAPDGVDGILENVGGAVLDAAMRRLNSFARVAICGLIAGGYDTTAVAMADTSMFLTARFKMQGFIVSDHRELWPEARAELADLVRDRRLKYRETVADGLEAAPLALANVLKGQNFGKQLVKLT